MTYHSRKNNSDVVIYHVALMLENPAEYFVKSEYRRRRREKEIEIAKNEVSNPELTPNGLKNRVAALKMLVIPFMVFGAYAGAPLMIIFGILKMFFLFELSAALMIYFMATAWMVSIRCSIASFDAIEFRKKASKSYPSESNLGLESFALNRHAEPKFYDLLPGIIFAILFYLFLNSDFQINS